MKLFLTLKLNQTYSIIFFALECTPLEGNSSCLQVSQYYFIVKVAFNSDKCLIGDYSIQIFIYSLYSYKNIYNIYISEWSNLLLHIFRCKSLPAFRDNLLK